MASPHVAGLLAYLLSIYPSVTFDPEIEYVQPTSPVATGLWAVVHANLPSWVASFLPTPQVSFTAAPIPVILSPAQLKAALLSLSTEGVLSDLPAKTINLLIFNNATDLKY